MFIGTPQKMELQSDTRTDYKHHNTVEFLVCVVPNSTITLSKCQSNYLSVFLDVFPWNSHVMAENGSIFFMSAARCIPSRRRAPLIFLRNSEMFISDSKANSQRTPTEINKIGDFAKVRISV